MEVRHGGKIIMPPSALEKLARLNITYPMLFKLNNNKQGTFTHCGVLEFIAEEGRIYVPHWVSRCTHDILHPFHGVQRSNVVYGELGDEARCVR